MSLTYIPIRAICTSLLKQEVLDIFYLIEQRPNLSQAEIKQIFAEYDHPDTKTTKYRTKIEIGIACLKAVLFIDSWRQGQSERYFLSEYGKEAYAILGELFEEDTEGKMLLGTKILSKQLQKREEVNYD